MEDLQQPHNVRHCKRLGTLWISGWKVHQELTCARAAGCGRVIERVGGAGGRRRRALDCRNEAARVICGSCNAHCLCQACSAVSARCTACCTRKPLCTAQRETRAQVHDITAGTAVLGAGIAHRCRQSLGWQASVAAGRQAAAWQSWAGPAPGRRRSWVAAAAAGAGAAAARAAPGACGRSCSTAAARQSRLQHMGNDCETKGSCTTAVSSAWTQI